MPEGARQTVTRRQRGKDESAAVQQAYDRIADQYVREIYDELRHKPLDRELLNRFAAHVRTGWTDL